MEKQEILRGMTMARMVQDRLNNQKYVTREEYDCDTKVVQIAVGDTNPTNASLWFDTSDYVSIQGETPTNTTNINNSNFISNTRPTENDVLWFNTLEIETEE